MEKIVSLQVDDQEFFGPLYELVGDEDITDVDFNGRDLWITDVSGERRKANVYIDQSFIEQFSKRVANLVSLPFNKQEPILEAQTEKLRITIIHESAAVSGRAFCIRKSLPKIRLSRESMVDSGYASDETISFLENCVKHHKNIVFCGEPGVGKTECAKFFAGYIPEYERVITIEETPEWHYRNIHNAKDCVELKVSEQMDYTKAIKTCLRMNPKWMMLSEARSTEVVYLLEGFSTGVKGFTTLHTDDVSNIPDRMVNMAGGAREEKRFINDIYTFVDVGVLIKRKEGQRYIDQVCLFSREDGVNSIHKIVEEGKYIGEKTI